SDGGGADQDRQRRSETGQPLGEQRSALDPAGADPLLPRHGPPAGADVLAGQMDDRARALEVSDIEDPARGVPEPRRRLRTARAGRVWGQPPDETGDPVTVGEERLDQRRP